MSEYPIQINHCVATIISHLVARRYAEIERLTNCVRLTGEQIEAAVAEYGRTICEPPISLFEMVDTTKVSAAVLPTWSVVVPLWTVEEGRSDLSLELTIVIKGNGVVVEFDDIHVL